MSEMNQEEFEIPNHVEKEDDLKLRESMNLSHLNLDTHNHKNNPHLCTACASTITGASNSMKLPSPEPILEPQSKKPPFDVSGYSMVPLPPLYRSASDSLTPTKTGLSSETAKALADTPFSKGTASSLPPKAPRPPLLSRANSDPIVSPVKSLSRTSSSIDMGVELIQEDSPSAKRLKRMKDRIKEMSHWMGEAMREVEDALATTEETKDDGELDSEEAVSVKKVGECLDVIFKCPCGKGYKILLSGKNCYYKLI